MILPKNYLNFFQGLKGISSNRFGGYYADYIQLHKYRNNFGNNPQFLPNQINFEINFAGKETAKIWSLIFGFWNLTPIFLILHDLVLDFLISRNFVFIVLKF